MSCKFCDETKAFKLTNPLTENFPYCISRLEDDIEGWILYNPSNKKFALQLPYGYIGELSICIKCGRLLT